ncbi:MAG: PfaD family polyunsaturated fatty acid/polyketide biosynthesis protein [Peptococcaceae bacterium]|jgi:PfaD family protein|nr:PfaD family polyunsaturated fatty acid/polyketide biosynthesis protein [Peptococcaceae bacterium]
MDAEKFGSTAFKDAYNIRYAYYAGSMANGISSDKMVIELGKAGYMGAFGSGGLSLDVVEQAIDHIQANLPNGPYLINLLHSNESQEERLISLFLRKSVRAIEASAFIDLSPALIRYRIAGLKKDHDSGVYTENRIVAKISREEVARKFMSPPDPKITATLLEKGLITAEQAMWAKEIPVADDITAEADSGGHTDNGPLVSLLPLIIAVRDEVQRQYGYKHPIRVGAAGGIGTALSAAGAFMMGADYVVTGSVNQACIEAGTSGYVKNMLARVDMADVVMAPSADMFEAGARVQVIKKGTMFPMNAQKLYELFTRHSCLEEIPAQDRKSIENRMFHYDLDTIYDYVKEYFRRVDESQIHRAESNAKYKMALIFRWYLGNSSRWAVAGDMERLMDMQIWCGKSMGAFNRWVQGSELELPENRRVVAVADKIMGEAALITINSYKKFINT